MISKSLSILCSRTHARSAEENHYRQPPPEMCSCITRYMSLLLFVDCQTHNGGSQSTSAGRSGIEHHFLHGRPPPALLNRHFSSFPVVSSSPYLAHSNLWSAPCPSRSRTRPTVSIMRLSNVLATKCSRNSPLTSSVLLLLRYAQMGLLSLATEPRLL